MLTLYHSTVFSSTLKVIATIKPVHSLVASVTDRILEPVLLDYITTSTHDYILKPSDASNLESGNVIFYIDDNLETFVKTFAKNNKKLVQLSKAVSLLLFDHIHSPGMSLVFKTKKTYISGLVQKMQKI